MLHYYDAINVRGLVPAHFPPRSYSTTLWRELENYILCKTTYEVKIEGKDIISYFETKGKKFMYHCQSLYLTREIPHT